MTTVTSPSLGKGEIEKGASSSAASLSVGKREAETQDPKDSDGEIEKGASSAMAADHSEEDDDSKELEWGYDSFDGLEYTSPRKDLFSDDESYQQSCRYSRQYSVYKGFHMDLENIARDQIGGIFPCSDKVLDEVFRSGETVRQRMGDLSKEAIRMYNQTNGTNVTFDKVVRMTHTLCRNYLTVLAKENPNEPPVEYRVKVIRRRVMDVYRPVFCKRAPSKS